ncbi:MAG: hypothetical protein R6U32_00090 [Candidatus Woesearchaeota archaeon]
MDLILIGMLLVLAGMAVIIIGSLAQSGSSSDGSSKVAVGGFIGFIPFGFANDRKLMYIAAGLMAALAGAYILFLLFSRQYFS